MQKYSTCQLKLLLEYLRQHPDDTFCAQRLAETLADKGISVSAIYRNLTALEEDGLVRRTQSDGCRHICYRYVAADECVSHLHMSCSECGRTFHMEVPLTRSLIENVERASDFTIDSSSTVLYGVCGRCRHENHTGDNNK